MKPAATHLPESAALADSASTAFLDALRDEQHRFLDSVRAAGAHVRDERGHLALVAAIQTRLAQQLFDAQRAFLRRQAAIDAEVARIDAGAEAAATARLGQVARSVDPGLVHLFPAPVVLSNDTNRVGVVPRADELDDVRDDAFDPVEIDPMLPQRQLAELLEQWWNRINADGQDMVDRAQARARLHAHAVSVETAGRELRLPQPQADTIAAPEWHLTAIASLPAPDAATLVPAVPTRAAPSLAAPTLAAPLLAAPSSAFPSLAGPAPEVASAGHGVETPPAPSNRAHFDPPVALAAPVVALAAPSALPLPSRPGPASPLPALTVVPSAGLAVQATLPLPVDSTSIDLAALLDALSRELRPMLALPPVAAGDDLSIKLKRWEDLDNSAVLDRLSALEPAPQSRRRRRSSSSSSPASLSSSSSPLPRSLGAAVGPAAADDHRDAFDHIVMRTIVPMAAVTAVITLIMALVG